MPVITINNPSARNAIKLIPKLLFVYLTMSCIAAVVAAQTSCSDPTTHLNAGLVFVAKDVQYVPHDTSVEWIATVNLAQSRNAVISIANPNCPLQDCVNPNYVKAVEVKSCSATNPQDCTTLCGTGGAPFNQVSSCFVQKFPIGPHVVTISGTAQAGFAVLATATIAFNTMHAATVDAIAAISGVFEDAANSTLLMKTLHHPNVVLPGVPSAGGVRGAAPYAAPVQLYPIVTAGGTEGCVDTGSAIFLKFQVPGTGSMTLSGQCMTDLTRTSLIAVYICPGDDLDCEQSKSSSGSSPTGINRINGNLQGGEVYGAKIVGTGASVTEDGALSIANYFSCDFSFNGLA